MSKFLKETSDFQEYLAAQAKDEGVIESNMELTYSEMSVIPGLVKPATFRLPVTLLAQLDELKKYTPYKSKAEMVMVMLQDHVDAFLNTTSDKVKDSFSSIAEDAFRKQVQSVADAVFKPSKEESSSSETQEEMPS